MANDATISNILRDGTGLSSAVGKRLVRDFATAVSTGAYKEFRTKYKLNREEWKAVSENIRLIEAAKAERDRRAKKPGKTKKVSAVSNVVELHPAERLEDNLEFVSDCCRFQEGILSEARMRMKYSFANSVWEKLADNSVLLVAVEDEKLRRMRSGATKREKAQLHVMRAPDIAAKIMMDDTANNRHRLDACKVLDDFSATGPTAVPAADRFVIQINLGADVNGNDIVERYSKSIKPLKPGEIDPDDVNPSIDVNSTGMIAGAITSERKDDDGNVV